MTKSIIKLESSKTLTNYFVHLSDELIDIRKYYEFGKLIIIDDIKDMHDKYKGFIANQVFSIITDDIKVKKAKGPALLANLEPNHILNKFTFFPADLQFCIKEISNWIFYKILTTCFPGYKVLSSNWTWRLTKTDKDDMHLDSYAGQNNNLHNVRIFMNLDDKPRIWRTSYALPEIYEKYKYIVQAHKHCHPNEINEILNKDVKWDLLPYHEILFAPWSIWMCNSQWISHQGYYGNKMAAYTFRVDPMSIKYPNLVFETYAKKIMGDWYNQRRTELNESRKLNRSGL